MLDNLQDTAQPSSVPMKKHAEDARKQGAMGASLRRSSILLLARREWLSGLNSAPLFLFTTVACLTTALLVRSYLDYIATNGTLVLTNPLKAPVLVAILICNAFLCLQAAAGLAGERERGTLEVLFYGPVDGVVYILGKGLGYLAVYATEMLLLLLFLLATTWLTGIQLDGLVLLIVVASVLPAAATIALGMTLAALVGRVRPAVALTALVLLVYIGIDLGNRFAASQPTNTAWGTAAQFLSHFSSVLAWLSPFAYHTRAADALAAQEPWGALLYIVGAAIYSVLLTALAVRVLRWRGVERWRE